MSTRAVDIPLAGPVPDNMALRVDSLSAAVSRVIDASARAVDEVALSHDDSASERAQWRALPRHRPCVIADGIFRSGVTLPAATRRPATASGLR